MRACDEALFDHIVAVPPLLDPPQDAPPLYHRKVAVDKEEAIALNVATLGQSHNPLWHVERRIRITASRAHELYSYNDWFFPQKTTEYLNRPPFNGNAATRYGLEMETYARVWYESNLQEGEELHQFGLVVSPHSPWLAVSPDGIIFRSGKPHKLLEIKCPVEAEYRAVSECHIPYIKDGCLDRNHTYFTQVQLGMSIIDVEKCDLVIFSPYSKSMIITVDRDDRYISSLVCTLYWFYFEHLINKMSENYLNSFLLTKAQ